MFRSYNVKNHKIPYTPIQEKEFKDEKKHKLDILAHFYLLGPQNF